MSNVITFNRKPENGCDTCPCAEECDAMPDYETATHEELDAWLLRCDEAAARKGGRRQCAGVPL